LKARNKEKSEKIANEFLANDVHIAAEIAIIAIQVTMNKKFLVAIPALAISALVFAQTMDANPMVGGASMSKSKNIVENAVNSKQHTTLVAAVKAAGLVDALASKGPFTVFAPTNNAFAALPAGTVDTLLKPENKATLTKVLTYHVVAGNFTSKDVMGLIKKNNGMAKVKTLAGNELTLSMNGPANVVVTDESGNTASISTYDVMQSNGVIHVIDTVLLPK
jgi:uncharacterized surface protein with fasciclin (FAS1) repeats